LKPTGRSVRLRAALTDSFIARRKLAGGMSGAVATVTDDNFKQFTGQPGLVLIDFWAPWCGPCKRIGPVIEQLSAEMPDVKFGKLNTDENQMTAATNGVMSIPTLMLYKNGQKVDQIVGAVPKEMLVASLKKAA
jgi:thioredoxin 1